MDADMAAAGAAAGIVAADAEDGTDLGLAKKWRMGRRNWAAVAEMDVTAVVAAAVDVAAAANAVDVASPTSLID